MNIFYLKRILLTSFCLIFSGAVFATCGDYEAKQASDKQAQAYVKGKIFKRALVLKKHLPSNRKEVASYVYVKKTDLYYTVYSLVNSECDAEIIKRTNGKH